MKTGGEVTAQDSTWVKWETTAVKAGEGDHHSEAGE